MIDVIVISWNARRHVERCLDSIRRTADGVPLSITVVDNGSDDGTVEMILRDHPSVGLVRNPHNRGVAPARNQGLRNSRGDYALLLDADAELTPGALRTLVDFMNRHPAVGLAGPALRGPDGGLQLSCRRFPTVATPLARRLGFLSQANHGRVLGRHMMADSDHNRPMPVDYVIGACQIIRRAARDRVGLLDGRIFYGPEDVDYCLRMWRQGWQVYYCPLASVVHHEQRMTKRNPFTLVALRHLLALFYFFRKYRFNPAKSARRTTRS